MYLKRKACAHRQCPTIHTEEGEYCKEHKDRYKKPDTRPSAKERGYDADWRRESSKYLLQHRWCECEECRRSGKPERATVVDHIKPHRGDMAIFWNRRNWQAMSKRHHDSKTALEDGGFGR
jgi:5-methylcytosine-specific restriction enzyme A